MAHGVPIDAADAGTENVATPLKILIVDDDITNRTILRSMLTKDGYEVVQAADGREAVSVFQEESPDLVLMDVMMPVMDGYEATRRIKEMTGDRMIPVIFLTGITDEEALAQCVECGGDGFLTKPYSRVLLAAHLAAHARVRTLYATLKAQKDELEYHQKRQKTEHEIAREVLQKAINPRALDVDSIQYVLAPSETFNGDVLLAAATPTGCLNILLGDFTGHGLPAAIGAVPTSEAFYTMTAKGCSVREIVIEVNRKIRRMLPTGLFCAASLVQIDPAHQVLTAWNGGSPDILIRGLSGEIRRRLVSQSFPLGIVDDDEMTIKIEMVPLEEGDRLYVASDGVIECTAPGGEFFGAERLEGCLDPSIPADRVFERIVDELRDFRNGAPQSDDITLIEITHRDSARKSADTESVAARHHAGMEWRSVLQLHPDSLRKVNPVPLLMHTISEVQGLKPYQQTLCTILTELFTNAVDHGVLGLSSARKCSPQGFTHYFSERESALAALREGWVQIDVEHHPLGAGGRLTIRVTDSGPGFDSEEHRTQSQSRDDALHGRGIALVRSLCSELRHEDGGRRAVAVFDWP